CLTMSASKPTAKKDNTAKFPSRFNGIAFVPVGLALLLVLVLKGSLWKDYPVAGHNPLLAIGSGEAEPGLLDRLAKEEQVSFPIILKLYQRILIHDTMKAGVYGVRQGMIIRQVLDMISNAENAQMNRILVIEGTTF